MNDPENDSMLPKAYPEHFKQQRPPTRSGQGRQQYAKDTPNACNFFEDSCSSPEPDVLDDSSLQIANIRGLFEVNDVSGDSYRLHPNHVACLADVLNVNYDYLNNLIRLLSLMDPDFMSSQEVMMDASQILNSLTNSADGEQPNIRKTTQRNSDVSNVIDEQIEFIADSQGVINID